MAEQIPSPSIDNIVAAAVQAERRRCIKLVCPHCANGNEPEVDGFHILETIQGYTAHTALCSAMRLRRLATN